MGGVKKSRFIAMLTLGTHKYAIDLMTAKPNLSVENGSAVADAEKSFEVEAEHSNSNGLHANVKVEEIVADSAEEARRYASCTRLNLKTGRDLINWAAQDAEDRMLELLLETFTVVANVTLCPNNIYFQHLLRYDPYNSEPILAAFTAGAEVNFLQLLGQATNDLFCESKLARRPPPNMSETTAEIAAENHDLTAVELVKKYFRDDTKSGLASKLMKSVVINILTRQTANGQQDTDEQSDHDDEVIDSAVIQDRFVKAKSALRKFINNDIALRQERAVLLFDFTAPDSAALTRRTKKSFTYVQQSKVSPDAMQKLSSADAAETILMPKMRCDCEFFELACSTELPTLHVDWPPPTKGCPCLGPFAQYQNNDPTTLLNINEKAARWTVIPDINTFPRMAGYYWQKRTELHEHRQGPLVFDLCVIPRSDDGTDMAFIFACSDECRCDESNCPTSTVFGMSRCFFLVVDYTSNGCLPRLGLQRYGLSTRETILEGQFIGKIVGHLKTKHDIDELADEVVQDEYSTARWQYVKRLPLPFGRAMLNEINQPQLEETFEFYVDQYAYGNFTRFIRHACGPNANVSVHLMLPRGTVDMRQRVMVLFANKQIEAGGELTVDFGDWYLGRTDPEAVCGCGETGCRRPLPQMDE